MKGYENNMADQDLVVRSLKVLKGMDGGAFREIRQGIDSLRKQVFIQAKAQEHYWDDLSDDGIISPPEKQSLRREIENIRRSYSAVTTQAAEYGYTGTLVQLLTQSHDALFSYVYETLALFDNMSENTPLPDRTLFNSFFSSYYYYESLILIGISTGIIDQINITVLTSLEQTGENNELGIYNGGLYQYTDGAWKSVTTGAYKGPRDELPGVEENAFFIASDNFYVTDVLWINGEELYINGEALGIKRLYEKGKIYYCQAGVWYAENNLSDWKYAAAFADVVNITGRLPQIFQNAIDAVNARVDAVTASINSTAATLSDEIATRQGQYTIIAGDIVRIDGNIDDIVALANSRYAELNGALGQKISHLPVYFGGSVTDPQNPQEGDFFTYTGATYGNREHTKVYRYNSGKWVGLDPKVTSNRSYYMMALEDILAQNDATNGYFAAIFAQALFTHDATLDTLSTKMVYLRDGGYIQSDNSQYVQGKMGLHIDANGNIDANGSTHIGGKCAIGVPFTGNTDLDNYDVIIGGNTKIEGEINAIRGSFGSDCKFYGKLYLRGIPFLLLGVINFSYNEGLSLISKQNVESMSRTEEGVYQINFTNPVWLKAHSFSGKRYIDVFVLGNAAENFDNGFVEHLLINPNWLRNSVDNKLPISGDYVLVSYVILYFINTSNILVDPRSAQIMILGAESSL